MTKDEFDGLAQAADHLPWVETTGGKFRLGRYGLLGTTRGLDRHRGDEPFAKEAASEQGVSLCSAWLRNFASLSARENRRAGSYGLKHHVQNLVGDYVSNGEFILAAARFGATVYADGTSPNAGFNLRFVPYLLDHRYHGGLFTHRCPYCVGDPKNLQLVADIGKYTPRRKLAVPLAYALAGVMVTT